MPVFCIGLMSGTSVDGIDAALVEFDPGIRLVFGCTYPWPEPVRERLVALGQGADAASLDEIGWLDALAGQIFADAALRLISETGISPAHVQAIGSHGQTVRHRPGTVPPFTWQIGDAHRIAENTGITTVADFRRRDIAAGGQGAPLVPAFHAALFRMPNQARAILNLGGIANVTLLPAAGPVRGFDTGPANALLDAWCLHCTGQSFDRDGIFAAGGQVDPLLLQRLLAEPWFAAPPPKSTGREHFHLDWLRTRLHGDERPQDVQATLLELSAVSIADALRTQQSDTRQVLVCGGGVRNPLLLQRLVARLPTVRIESTAEYGVDPDFIEAMAFAWLAHETLARRPGNLPDVTGARGLRVLGAIHPA